MARPKARKFAQDVPDPIAAAPAEEAAPPPKKQRKNSKLARVRGKQGKLQVFNNLPLDLIYEICSNLEPADLLALSTTSKVFRSVVTGNASKGLWLAARARVGLPELELANMTDLQYAQLMHGKGCSFCERKNAGKPDVYMRARICTACLKEHFACEGTTAGNTAIFKATGGKKNALALLCCKATSSARGGPYYRLAELTKVNNELAARQYTSPAWADVLFARQRAQPQYYLMPGEELQEPETDFQRDFAAKDEERNARRNDGDKLQAWLREQEEAKANDKDGIRKARREELVTRFKQQGFDETELDNYTFYNNAVVRQPAAVTERTWPRIEESLKPVLYDIRRKSRRATFFNAYGAFKRQHPDNRSLPSTDLLDNLPVAKVLLEDVSSYVHGGDLFTAHEDEIKRDLEALLRSRREAMLRKLAMAHASLREAVKQTTIRPSFEGLSYSDIELPRLPPWIPRDAASPLHATDEQISTFLESSPLAFFECAGCKRLLRGSDVIEHVGRRWGCFSSDNGHDCEPDKWARVDGPSATLTTSRDILCVALKLGQLLSDTPLEVDEHERVDKDAEEAGVKMSDDEKFQVSVKCSCTVEPLSYSSYNYTKIGDAYHHIQRYHSTTAPDPRPAKLKALVNYSSKFRNAMAAKGRRVDPLPGTYDAVDLDIMNSFGFGMGYDDGYGYDSYSDEDEEMYGRDDCVVM
ncbi:hypothetical protein JCM10213_002013 [Rhodosporidiobolus nylandii]